MARFLTPRGLRAIQAEVEGAALLPLVTIAQPPSAAVLRAVPNTVPITSRGMVFHPYAFEFALPEDSLDRQPEAQFRIDNVDQVLVDTLRAASAPPEVTIEVIVSDSPDVVELALPQLLLRNATWDAAIITGRLQLDDIFGLAYPSRHATYDPAQFPGLFA